MTATYDINVGTDRDQVRLLIGDTDTTSPHLQDEEIDFILTDESNVFLAAARALGTIQAKWLATSSGLEEKEVEDLRLKWGGWGSSGGSGIGARIQELKEEGVRRLAPSPSMFRTLG